MVAVVRFEERETDDECGMEAIETQPREPRLTRLECITHYYYRVNRSCNLRVTFCREYEVSAA